MADGEVKLLRGLDLSKEKDNTTKRNILRKTLNELITNMKKKAITVTVIIERIRLQSGGFININYIKSIGALNAVIVDACHNLDVKVYSVDTRAWKAQVIGTAKAEENAFGVPEKKWPTVQFVIKRGFEANILQEITTRKRKNTFVRDGKRYMYSDDIADSMGIALYHFKGKKSLLEEEK